MFAARLTDLIPLWLLFTVMLPVVLVSIKLGSNLGRKRKKDLMVESDSPIGTVVGATLGLLALMLAFTFSMTLDRFNSRKDALIEDLNAISTLYYRADFLAEPNKANLQNQIKEYVKIRASLSAEPEALHNEILKSEQLLDNMWDELVSSKVGTNRSAVDAQLILAMNNVIDAHSTRVIVGTQQTIPIGIWLVLLIVFIIAMWAMGFQFGYVGHYSFIISFGVALVFTSIIFLIADMDSSQQGIILINHEPMIELSNKLNN